MTGIDPSSRTPTFIEHLLLSMYQDIAEFERHVDRLAVAQAMRESRLGRNDMLIHCLPDDMLGGIFSILDIKTYLPTALVVPLMNRPR